MRVCVYVCVCCIHLSCPSTLKVLHILPGPCHQYSIWKIQREPSPCLNGTYTNRRTLQRWNPPPPPPQAPPLKHSLSKPSSSPSTQTNSPHCLRDREYLKCLLELAKINNAVHTIHYYYLLSWFY